MTFVWRNYIVESKYSKHNNTENIACHDLDLGTSRKPFDIVQA